MMIYIPNILTLLRIGLVPVFIVLMQDKQYLFSLIVFLVAGITDMLDGFIAKRFDAITKLGSILDPIADKFFLVSAFVMLSAMQLIPFWLTVAVVFRDLLIVGGYLLFVLFFGKVTMSHAPISKLNTFLQIVFVLFVLSNFAWSLDMAAQLHILSFLVLASCLLSGFNYVWVWSIKAMDYNN